MPCYHALVEKQRAYFKSGATRPLENRKETLNKLKKMLEEDGEQIAAAIFKDLHRDGHFETFGVTHQINETLEKLEEWSAPTKLSSDGNDELFIVREPVGVVLVISPWNYPLFTSAPLVQALAAGNTVILKPSELAQHTAQAFEKIINKHFDENVFAVVNGAVEETTALLSERFDHIVYTGNPAVAKIVMAAAAKNLTPVTLELGGKNPTVVLDDADVALAAEKIAKAKMMNCGQICINPDYVLTTSITKPKLISAIQQVFEKEGELKENKAFARIISERHFDRLKALTEKTNGKLAWKAGGEENRSERYLPPSIYEIEENDELMKDEIFGPILPILTVDNLEKALDFVKEREKPLAAYIFSKDPEAARRFITETWSGGVCVNDVHSHAFSPSVPFGGVGNSGLGRINGKYSFDNFTHEKAVLIRGGVSVPQNKL
ncbi:unnamed protein product, partial [Mesorhabditis spiculigera]